MVYLVPKTLVLTQIQIRVFVHNFNINRYFNEIFNIFHSLGWNKRIWKDVLVSSVHHSIKPSGIFIAFANIVNLIQSLLNQLGVNSTASHNIVAFEQKYIKNSLKYISYSWLYEKKSGLWLMCGILYFPLNKLFTILQPYKICLNIIHHSVNFVLLICFTIFLFLINNHFVSVIATVFLFFRKRFPKYIFLLYFVPEILRFRQISPWKLLLILKGGWYH